MTDHFESPELLHLFGVYTASPTSIGAHFGQAAQRLTAQDPMIVATGTDLALFPGGGAAPTVESFRLAARGFKEMAAVSHLGPAVATLARMRELEPDGTWRTDAQALLDSTREAREANTPQLWEKIDVAAFIGRETSIARMVDYTCRVTERVLEKALADSGYLTARTLRREYFDGPADDLLVPVNRIMVATFFLTGLDLAYRLLSWFDGLDLPWERTMVLIAGRQGRPTSGVTRETNSIAGVISIASRGRLADHRLLIAPHAPVFGMFDGHDLGPVVALEPEYRRLWSWLIATSDLGAEMFDGYARYEPTPRQHVRLGADTPSVSEMPAIAGPDDWFAMTTRLRVVLEDPRQLLSGAVTDYAIRQLVDHDNRPADVTVPGLDAEPYPDLPPDLAGWQPSHSDWGTEKEKK